MAKKKRAKRSGAVNVIEGIVIAILILLIAGMLLLYFSFRSEGAAPELLGYTFYRTKATNMEPDIPSGSAIIAKNDLIDEVKPGSVVLCRMGENDSTVLTRVVQLVNEDGVTSYIVKFQTGKETYKLSEEKIVAKAVWISTAFGAVLGFATSTLGIMLVIIIPSFIIIVFQIIKIVNAKQHEEDAVDLDDLDDIMMSGGGDEFGFDFAEPTGGYAPQQQMPMQQDIQQYAQDQFSPEMSENGGFGGYGMQPSGNTFEEPDNSINVLNIDSRGKAELKPTAPENVPLFTYEDMRERADQYFNLTEQPQRQQAEMVLEQPVQQYAPQQDPYQQFPQQQYQQQMPQAAPSEAFAEPYQQPANGQQMYYEQPAQQMQYGQQYNQQYAQPAPAEQQYIPQQQPMPQQHEQAEPVQFMSNVIPEQLANTVSQSEMPMAFKEMNQNPVKVTPKPVREERSIKSANSIPSKAAMPKEKIAPPKRKSSAKAIRDLMSMIDAEEAKLNEKQ